MNKKVYLIVAGVLFLAILLVSYLRDIRNIEEKGHSDPAATESTEPSSRETEPIDPETGLVVGPGLTLVKTNCLGCHSAKIIAQNKASRDTWKETIRWMQETQNLWELGDNEPKILDYLAKYYAPEKPGRRLPLQDIEWYELKE